MIEYIHNSYERLRYYALWNSKLCRNQYINKESIKNKGCCRSFDNHILYIYIYIYNNSMDLVRERNIPTERPPLDGKVSGNFCATDPHGCILGFLDRSRYFFFQVAAQLYSRGSVDPVPDPLLVRKSGSSGNRTRARNSDH
jgi:hypothetical protein